jgi:hypothetical protein
VRRDPTEKDVGTYWLGPDGHVWKLIAYCAYPTASWERVDDPTERRGGAAHSLIAREFVRLIPEPDA